MNALLSILIILLLILLNGFFVAAEFAIVAAPRTRLQQLSDNGSAAAKNILDIIHDPGKLNQYFTTAQAGITIASLGLGMYGEHVLAGWLVMALHHLNNLAQPAAHTIALIISVSFLTYLHVVIGEMIPKSLALQSAEKLVLLLYTPMQIIKALLFPLVFLLNNAGIIVTRLLNIPPPDPNDKYFTAQELEYIVEHSFHGGEIESSDHLFIDNILDLDERISAHVMTTRNNIHGIPVESDLTNTMDIVCRSTKTRYPVYSGDLDNVIGTLHIKDLARYINNDHDQNGFSLHELIRPPLYIPESMPLNSLLLKFHDSNQMFAVVFDEYGGTSGIITLEDLIEEVVGEIQDEYDTEPQPIDEINSNLLRVRGNVILAELNQLYHLEWDYPDVNTVGGLIMALSGRIPEPDDTVVYQNARLIVESMDGKAVGDVLIYLPK